MLCSFFAPKNAKTYRKNEIDQTWSNIPLSWWVGTLIDVLWNGSLYTGHIDANKILVFLHPTCQLWYYGNRFPDRVYLINNQHRCHGSGDFVPNESKEKCSFINRIYQQPPFYEMDGPTCQTFEVFMTLVHPFHTVHLLINFIGLQSRAWVEAASASSCVAEVCWS